MAKRPAHTRPPQRPQPKPQPKPRSASIAASKSTAGRWEPAGWLPYALFVLAVTAICYSSSVGNGFVNWDDPVNIYENPNLERVGKGASWGETIAHVFSLEKGAVIGNYNPLPVLTFAIEKAINGGEHSARLIHFDNLLLHLLTVFFAMRLLLHLGVGRWGALAGGLLFGIHPMRVESVAWATERKDVLFAVFFFAALMYYVRWVKTDDASRRTRLYLLMLVLAVLSLFAKVQAVALPLSMLAIDYLLRRPLTARTVVVEKLPFWALSLVFGLINIYTLRLQGSTNDDVTGFNFLQRLCVGAYSLSVYLYKLFLPIPMSPLYPYPKVLPPVVYAAPVAALAFLGLIVWWWKQDRRWPVFGAVFFLFNVVFLLQIFAAGQGFQADRFTYVPYFGFFAVAAWLFDRYVARPEWRTGAQIGLGVLCVGFGFWTVRQTGIWKNGETLWSHVIQLESGEKTKTALPFWNRGQYFRDQKQYDKSLQDYTQAITINPKDPELYNSRGKTYFDMAMLPQYQTQSADLVQKAVNDYTAALQNPGIKKTETRASILINRGAAFGAQKKYVQAVQDVNEGIGMDPTNENGYLNRSLVYLSLNQLDKAIADYTEYLKYDPYNANIHYERGMLYRSTQRNAEAVADLTQALKLQPDLGLAYLERARANAQAGNKAAARQDYQKAQQFKIQLSAQDVQMMGGQ